MSYFAFYMHSITSILSKSVAADEFRVQPFLDEDGNQRLALLALVVDKCMDKEFDIKFQDDKTGHNSNAWAYWKPFAILANLKGSLRKPKTKFGERRLTKKFQPGSSGWKELSKAFLIREMQEALLKTTKEFLRDEHRRAKDSYPHTQKILDFSTSPRLRSGNLFKCEHRIFTMDAKIQYLLYGEDESNFKTMNYLSDSLEWIHEFFIQNMNESDPHYNVSYSLTRSMYDWAEMYNQIQRAKERVFSNQYWYVID